MKRLSVGQDAFFACDNDVVDCQTVNMEMENGARIVFTANAFNEQDHRHTEIRGSKGILIADDRGSVITLKLFGKKTKKIIVNFVPVIKGTFRRRRRNYKSDDRYAERKLRPEYAVHLDKGYYREPQNSRGGGNLSP